jgi:acyl carrier protein
MTTQHIQDRIRHFIARELLEGNDEGLDEATPLLELGVVDSMGIVELTTFIEAELGTAVPPEELSAENFSSIGALSQMVARLGA